MTAVLRQSVGYMELVTSLAAGAIVTWLVWTASEDGMASLNERAQLAEVRRSVQWTEVLLNNLPVIFLIIAVVGSLAFTVYQTRFA